MAQAIIPFSQQLLSYVERRRRRRRRKISIIRPNAWFYSNNEIELTMYKRKDFRSPAKLFFRTERENRNNNRISNVKFFLWKLSLNSNGVKLFVGQ